MAVTSNGTIANGTTKSNDSVAKLQKQVRQAHLRHFSRLATLSTQVSEKPSGVDVDDILAHGATTTFFGEIFSLIQRNELRREELDQRLINWILRVPAIKEKFNALPENVRGHVEGFRLADTKKGRMEVRGFRRPTRSAARKCAALKETWEEQLKLGGGKKFPAILENNGEIVVYVEKAVFKNWGETVESTPAITFIPKSVVGVQNIVKYAKEVGKKVRVHTWTNVFSNDDEILISLLPLDTAEDLPSIAGTFSPGKALLQQIHLLPDTVSSDGSTILCKVGTATTNEQFRQWCLSPDGGANQWTLPSNVIMVEITFGGSISQICHGAGIGNKSLSDLVAEVEYVDANGLLQTVSDPNFLRAAAGSFGLLGIITAYTIRLNKMTYAAMRPYRSPVELAIPPPWEYIVAAKAGDEKYKYINDLISRHSQETLDMAQAEFIQRAETHYYAEWFWFPLQKDVWVNTWENNGSEAESRNIPSDFEAFLEWLEEWIAEQLNNWAVYQLLPGEVQAKILGFFTLIQLPNITDNDRSLTTQLINALHFRRGIQNMQVSDMEWEIPIPAQSVASKRHSLPQPSTTTSNGFQRRLSRKGHRRPFSFSKISEPTTSGTTNEAAAPSFVETGEYTNIGIKRDWSITQKAWWDAILQIQAEPSIVRVALEMRIMGDSNILLAPQRGNHLGTCSIEVLSTPNTPTDDWHAFCQKLANKWTSYTDPSTGQPLRARPHWCKQWSFLSLPDNRGGWMTAPEWMRNIGYKGEIPEFLGQLKRIGIEAGFTLEDLRARFGNELLESIFWTGAEVQDVVVESDDKSRDRVNKFKKWLKKVFS